MCACEYMCGCFFSGGGKLELKMTSQDGGSLIPAASRQVGVGGGRGGLKIWNFKAYYLCMTAYSYNDV